MSVDGWTGSVHVREDGVGAGPTVVLIHGFTASLHWYDLVVARLAADHHLVRVDLVGHAGTGGPAVDAPVQARAVGAVLDQLGVAGATAVGHSFGADVAVALAEDSARVERLVILAQAPDYSDATLPRGSMIMAAPVVGATLCRTAQLVAAAGGAALRLRPGTSPARELAAQGLRDLRAIDPGLFRTVLVDRRDRMAQRPLDAQVRDAGKPTLVVLGSKDHFYGDRPAPRYRAAGARVEILAGSGHSPIVDQPDETADLLRAFVAVGPAPRS